MRLCDRSLRFLLTSCILALLLGAPPAAARDPCAPSGEAAPAR